LRCKWQPLLSKGAYQIGKGEIKFHRATLTFTCGVQEGTRWEINP